MEKRLWIGIGSSVILNLALWAGVADTFHHHVAFDNNQIEMTRVTIDESGKKVEQKVDPKTVEKKVEQLKEEQKLTPPKQPAPVSPAPKAVEPPAGHNTIATTKSAVPTGNEVPTGGNLPVGKPTETQAPGTGTGTTETPVQPPVKPVDSPKPEPKPVVPPPEPEKKPAPEPPKKDPPKPVGITREAEPGAMIQPELPDSIRTDSYKSFVRVKVEISEDGSFEVVLRTSSGNPEIDKRVLDALKKWRWKPAMKNGEPVKSTKLFKFEFEVK